MSTTALTTELVTAAIFVSILSFLYRDNPFYRITQSIIVGITAAQIVLTSITNIIRYDITPIPTTPILIISCIWGLSYYTYFSDKYRDIFRTVLMFSLGIDFGGRFAGNMWQMNYSIWYNATHVIDAGNPAANPMKIVNVIVAATAFLYFIYWKRFQDSFGQTVWLRSVRSLFRYVAAIFFGWICSMWFLQQGTADIDLAIRIMKGVGAGGVGMYVVYIAAIAIAADIVISQMRKSRKAVIVEKQL